MFRSKSKKEDTRILNIKMNNEAVYQLKPSHRNDTFTYDEVNVILEMICKSRNDFNDHFLSAVCSKLGVTDEELSKAINSIEFDKDGNIILD